MKSLTQRLTALGTMLLVLVLLATLGACDLLGEEEAAAPPDLTIYQDPGDVSGSTNTPVTSYPYDLYASDGFTGNQVDLGTDTDVDTDQDIYMDIVFSGTPPSANMTPITDFGGSVSSTVSDAKVFIGAVRRSGGSVDWIDVSSVTDPTDFTGDIVDMFYVYADKATTVSGTDAQGLTWNATFAAGWNVCRYTSTYSSANLNNDPDPETATFTVAGAPAGARWYDSGD